MPFAPIAVFAYKRLDHLQRLFESLQKCNEFSGSDVVIFVDGPKGPADEAAVASVRSFAQNSGLPNVRARISEKNKGLKRSICAGVTAMCAEYGRVIVLEDDLTASPALLRYFNQALDRYEHVDRVYSVSAYIYDCPGLRETNRALVLPITNSWGWATWRRAWDGFDPDEKIEDRNLDSNTFQQLFNLAGLYPLANLLKESVKKSVDSWFIHWYFHIFRNGGVTIYPPRRYVENFGTREGATHGSRLNPFELLVRKPEMLNRDVEFPDASQTDYWAMDLLKRCHEVVVHRWIARAGAAKRRLAFRRLRRS